MNIENLQDWVEAVASSPKTTRAESNRLSEIQFHYNGYAETGYSDPASGIIATGNWNCCHREYVTEEDGCSRWVLTQGRDTIKRVSKILEHLGVELEWSDEWTTCSDCGKLVRSQANSYDWSPSYAIIDECELYCCECLREHPEMVLEEYEGECRKALSPDLGIDPTEHGYKLVLDDLENGFHYGMDADPKVIAKEMENLGVSRFLFAIKSNSQFYTTFQLYVHEDELDNLPEEPESIKTDGPSIAGGLERALREASLAMHEAGKILVTKCDPSTGTATSRNVTPEEFIKGI